jgi:hypothetical protein
MDIFDALYKLKNQAYHYEINGIDGPIKLCDPLLRRPTNLKRLPRLLRPVLKHLSSVESNPLDRRS